MDNLDWYSNPYVLRNMVTPLYNREFSYTALRARDNKPFHKKSMTASNYKFLHSVLTNPSEHIIDVYTSLSVYDLSPIMGCTHTAKTKFFAKTIPNYWIHAYDLDSKDDILKSAVQTGQLVSKLTGINPEWFISIKYSGEKGFHIETQQRGVFTQAVQENKCTADELKYALNLDTIDLAIYTPRREWRCPYSIHHSGKVAMPLTLKEFTMILSHLPSSVNFFYPDKAIKHFAVKDQGYKWFSLRGNDSPRPNSRTKEDLEKLVIALDHATG